MRKKLLFLVVSLLFVLAACGTTTNGSNSHKQGNQATGTESLLEQIKAEGKIKIGTEGTYAPFTFHDSSGKLTGFDVEIAEEIAKRLGVKAEFIETQWDGMFAGLDSKRFDMIANQVSIRPDRQKKYDFSDPYIASKGVLIVNKDNNTIKSFDDLKGIKVAGTFTNSFKDKVVEHGGVLVPVEGFNQAIDLIASKRVGATINDSLSFYDLKKQKPDVPVKVVAEYTLADQNAIMFRKGHQDLIDAVNKALSDMKQDGTYLKISEKYFGVDVSKGIK